MSVVLGFHHYRARNRPKSTGIGVNQYGRRTRSAASGGRGSSARSQTMSSTAAHGEPIPPRSSTSQVEEIPPPLSSPGMACCVFVSVVTICIGIIMISFAYLPPGDRRPFISIGGPLVFTIGLIIAILTAIVRLRAVRNFKKWQQSCKSSTSAAEFDDRDDDEDQPDAEAHRYEMQSVREQDGMPSSVHSSDKPGSGMSRASGDERAGTSYVKLPPINQPPSILYSNAGFLSSVNTLHPLSAAESDIGPSASPDPAPQTEFRDQHQLPPISLAPSSVSHLDTATIVSMDNVSDDMHRPPLPTMIPHSTSTIPNKESREGESSGDGRKRSYHDPPASPRLSMISDGRRTSYISEV